MSVKQDAGAGRVGDRGDRRLFFALWPAGPLQVALADTIRAVLPIPDGRVIPPGNYHVTLAFLGSVPSMRMAELDSIAQSVAQDVPVIRIVFDRIEYWKKPRIVCVSGADAPVASQLASKLQERLSGDGFHVDPKPFRPHVTLARKVPSGVERIALTPVVWDFATFALVDSRTPPDGSLYSVLQSWTLVTADAQKTGKNS